MAKAMSALFCFNLFYIKYWKFITHDSISAVIQIIKHFNRLSCFVSDFTYFSPCWYSSHWLLGWDSNFTPATNELQMNFFFFQKRIKRTSVLNKQYCSCLYPYHLPFICEQRLDKEAEAAWPFCTSLLFYINVIDWAVHHHFLYGCSTVGKQTLWLHFLILLLLSVWMNAVVSMNCLIY